MGIVFNPSFVLPKWELYEWFHWSCLLFGMLLPLWFCSQKDKGLWKRRPMAKTDIKSLFILLPVHPFNFRLLGFHFSGQFYFEKALTARCTISYVTLRKLSTILEWAEEIGTLPITSYANNFLFIECVLLRFASRSTSNPNLPTIYVNPLPLLTELVAVQPTPWTSPEYHVPTWVSQPIPSCRSTASHKWLRLWQWWSAILVGVPQAK